jgi:orotidine-5'-phosphate decarboxylase
VSALRDPRGFGDRLAEAVAARESQLVLGLDPDPGRLWPAAMGSVATGPAATGGPAAGGSVASAGAPAQRAARAVVAHCRLAIDATAEFCVAVKLQVACFERLGAGGWAALAEVADHARGRGLLVLADAKRGDIDVTAAAYAQAFLGATATPFGVAEGLSVDALTVNPLLGADSLAPLLACARQHARGLFVLVHTSNPGAADIQELVLADGRSLSERLADLVAELGAEGVGASGLSDVGAVVGATAPEWVGRLRPRMPAAVFLLPGVGAQGGSLDGLGAAFAPGAAGGLLAVSRGIVDAGARVGGDPARAARAEAARLREAAWKVALSRP